MSEIERIDYSYRLSYDHRAAIALAEYKQAGWRGQFQMWGLYLCIAVAIFIVTIALRTFLSSLNARDILYKVAFLGGAATIAATMLSISTYCYLQRLISNSRSRSAATRHGSVSADGVAESRNSMKSQCGWPDIEAVERTAKLTLLLLGDGSAYVIPHDALPEAVTADILHDRIDAWRKSAGAGHE